VVSIAPIKQPPAADVFNVPVLFQELRLTGIVRLSLCVVPKTGGRTCSRCALRTKGILNDVTTALPLLEERYLSSSGITGYLSALSSCMRLMKFSLEGEHI
jgi:hypothetical protein